MSRWPKKLNEQVEKRDICRQHVLYRMNYGRHNFFNESSAAIRMKHDSGPVHSVATGDSKPQDSHALRRVHYSTSRGISTGEAVVEKESKLEKSQSRKYSL